MKILIWLACIFLYSAVITGLRMAGITLGGVPTAALAVLLVFLPAPLICNVIGRKKETRIAPSKPITEREKLCGTPFIQAGQTVPGMPKDPPLEKWYTCSKCGQLVREGEACDCITHQQAEPSKEPEAAVPTRKLSVVPLVLLCMVLVLAGAVAGAFLSHDKVYDEGWSKGYDAAERAVGTRYKREVAKLEAELEETQSSLQAARKDYYASLGDAAFLHMRIGIIVEDGTKRYHDHGSTCIDAYDNFWAHNIEYCESLGYYACPLCWKGN